MAIAQVKQEAALARLAAAPAPASTGGWLDEAREAARGRLQEMGLPGRRDEYWRWTDPTPLNAPEPQQVALPEGDGSFGLFEERDALRLVFTDGALDAGRSDALALEGIEITPLAEAGATAGHWAEALFATLESRAHQRVARPHAALNAALAGDGLVIRVTGRPERPLHIVHRREREASDVMLHHLIRLEPGAEMTLLETGAPGARANIVIEAELGEGATLHHVRSLGREHERRAITQLFARLDAGAQLKTFTMSANGALTRNDYLVWLDGEGASAHIAGGAVGDGACHQDDTVFVSHEAAHCESRQVFKKVLREGATGIFQGKILVRPGAQKTDGYQIAQGLLLDERAVFDSKPELEIHADDVACSHGTTCGEIDPDQLFYLRARGIDAETAEGLLVLAFLAQAVDEIADEQLAAEVRAGFEGWLARHRR